MQRVLIADSSCLLGQEIKRILKGAYEVEICQDGFTALELIRDFEPDVLVLDMWLPYCDGLDLLHNLRSVGNAVSVIALVRSLPGSTENLLRRYGVSYVFPKPCSVSAVAACVNSLCLQTDAEKDIDAGIENEIKGTLLRLGFAIGTNRFNCVYNAILITYNSGYDMLWKLVYPEVARICGGTVGRVEKAIRDARTDAFRHGDMRIWELYFPPGKSGKVECPSNENFVLRIVEALKNRERLKKAYMPKKEIAL